MNDLPDIDKIMRTYANQEAERNTRLEVARWYRELEYQNHLARLDAEIAALEAEGKDAETTLRQQLAAYVADTGDLHPHESVTVRRVHPLRYDKAAAFAWAEENAPYLLRVKKELDVRLFEDAVKNDRIKWDGAETVNEVQIVLRPLGHLVEQKSEGE